MSRPRDIGESIELQLRGNGSLAPSIDDIQSLDSYDANGESASEAEFFDDPPYTPEEERVVIRKLDRRFVLFLAFLYMLSFLDRSNIGNARIAGLDRDLNLSSSQYSWILSAFYITYLTFQFGTLLYAIIPIHVYMSICVASWSMFACAQAVSTSFLSMFVLRGLLGMAEALFSPGLPFVLSTMYRRDELASRIARIISAAPLAASFASSLAWVIMKMAEHTPIAAWRLLFLVEGSPAVFAAVAVWFHINPEKASYLSRREKRVAKLRLRTEKDAKKMESCTVGHSKLDFTEITQALRDVKCWITAACFFCCNLSYASLPPFLPTIIEDMNHSALTSQALAFPPYLFSFAVVLLIASLSDRSKDRSFYIICLSLWSGFGYIFIAVTGVFKADANWRYFGVYPAASGFFSCVVLLLTWTLNGQKSDIGKAVSVTLLNLVGQLGPLVGVRLYPDSDKPYYVRGMTICGLAMFGVAVTALILRRILIKENERMAHQYEQVDGKVKTRFTYML